MSIHDHLREHHGLVMHPDADLGNLHDLHHHDHTFNRPGHKLTEHLEARPDAKSDRGKPR